MYHTLNVLSMRFMLSIMAAAFFTSSYSQTFSSSNLPIIVLNTNNATIVDEPKIIADIGIIYNGPGVRNNLSDPFNNFSGQVGIEIRGSSSQYFFPKKQYGVEVVNEAGQGIDTMLLDMPA